MPQAALAELPTITPSVLVVVNDEDRWRNRITAALTHVDDVAEVHLESKVPMQFPTLLHLILLVVPDYATAMSQLSELQRYGNTTPIAIWCPAFLAPAGIDRLRQHGSRRVCDVRSFSSFPSSEKTILDTIGDTINRLTVS